MESTSASTSLNTVSVSLTISGVFMARNEPQRLRSTIQAVKELILNNQLLAMQSYGMGMSDVSQASAWAQEQEMLDFQIPDLR